MIQCRFCQVNETTKALDGKPFDFYVCDECESIMCHVCTQTSAKTGKDHCKYCIDNLRYEGKRI